MAYDNFIIKLFSYAILFFKEGLHEMLVRVKDFTEEPYKVS